MEKIRKLLSDPQFHSLAGDSSWSIFSQAVVVLVNIGTVYLLANLLSPNDYGQFKLITTWLAIAVGVGYTGYTYTLPQQLARGQNYNLPNIFKKTFLKSLPTFLGLFIISLYYLYNQNFNLGSGFFFGAFLAPVLCTSTIVNLYYMGKRNFKMFALTQNFVDIVQLAAISLLAYFSHNFVFIISLYFIFTLLANVLVIFKTVNDDKKYKSAAKFQDLSKQEIIPEEDKLTKMRSKLNISAIVFGFVNQIDKLLIFHFLGAVPLAIYSIVTAISDQARTPIKAISSAIFPRMSSDTFTKKKLYAVYLLMTSVCILIYIFLLITYPLIFKYVFPKYQDYVHYANLFSLTIIFAPVNIFYLYAQSKNDLHTLNTYANINTVCQVVFFGASTFLGLVFFFYSKIAINIISLVYVYSRIRKL